MLWSRAKALKPAAAPAVPRRTLTVEQVVAQALRQNPTRSAAELSRDQARAGVTAEEGRYPYVLAGDAGYTRVTHTDRHGSGRRIEYQPVGRGSVFRRWRPAQQYAAMPLPRPAYPRFSKDPPSP